MIEDTSKEFIKRHIGPTSHEENTMVKKVGAQSLEDLIEKTVPQKILIKDNLKIDEPKNPDWLIDFNFDQPVIKIAKELVRRINLI